MSPTGEFVSNPLPLALDAMGGDHAPGETVQGAVDYVRQTGSAVTLVGREPDLRGALAESVGYESRLPLTIEHAPETIDFGEGIKSIRNKRHSSIHVGARLVRHGQASAFVSAGHTGAMMAICKSIFGLLDGVDRPALPAPLPRLDGGYNVLLDAGANVDCRPEHFRQFAVMGYHYSRRIFGVEDPRVGLLSIGEEDAKGNQILKEVAAILRETHINFVGNVEGTSLFRDHAEVIVCDGFVGNVALKVAEGLAETLLTQIKRECTKTPLRKLAAWTLRPGFREIYRRADYAEYGGVPLLGLQQVAIVAHGRSHARAIHSALRVAQQCAASPLLARIADDIAALHQAERKLAV